MKTNIWKYFVDSDKTEDWLNEMAQEGMNCVGASCMMHRYTFEQGEPNEYAYRIIYLDSSVNHMESIRYLNFLKESGIELVSQMFKVVILRKKIADGEFEIYTDKASQLKHCKTLMWSSVSGIIICTLIVAFNVYSAILNASHNNYHLTVLGILTTFMLVIVIILQIPQWRRNSLKIKRIKQEQKLHE
ncbi:MAG: DUF2812 domain-containing protein [Defluviitaleaceae bacterium]|nr:DUF2812 domain-containing protein [Defluviitaleaceae bacterium]